MGPRSGSILLSPYERGRAHVAVSASFFRSGLSIRYGPPVKSKLDQSVMTLSALLMALITSSIEPTAPTAGSIP